MGSATHESLDAIGVRFGTDKSSLDHDYLSFYESYLEPLREAPLKILEIGVLGGASLRTWHAYFPSALIVGMDISPFAAALAGDRVSIEIADQTNVQELTDVAIKHGPFDVVIEDGSHMWADQILALRTLFPFVKNDGLYIVEDLQTNYGAERERYRGSATVSCTEYLKMLLDLHVGETGSEDLDDSFLRTYAGAVSSLSFSRGVCVIEKRYRATNHRERAGLPLPKRDPAVRHALLRLSVHVSNVGDVDATDAGIHSGSTDNAIQGFAIETRDGEELLEYRARFVDGSWTDWVAQGRYAGSRGQARPLTGLAVRLLPKVRDARIECVGLFGNDSAPVRAIGGGDCVGKAAGWLYGFQVNVSRS